MTWINLCLVIQITWHWVRAKVAPVPQLVVGAVIVDDLTHPIRILAAKRSEQTSLAGGWEFPGGKVEAGETPTEALVREVIEELGVMIEVGEELKPPEGLVWPINADLEMRLWFAEIKNGEPQPLEEHDELLWLTRETLTSVPWLQADVAVLPFIFR